MFYDPFFSPSLSSQNLELVILRNNHLSLAQTSTIMSIIFKSSLRNVVCNFLKYVWMKKCVKICVMLFKMWTCEFEIDDQTGPKLACNWSMYVYLIIYIYIYIFKWICTISIFFLHNKHINLCISYHLY